MKNGEKLSNAAEIAPNASERWPELVELVRAELDAQNEQATENIKSGRDDWQALRDYSTPARWDAFRAGKLSEADAIEKATARAERQNAKSARAKLERLEAAAVAAPVVDWSINIDWTSSRTCWANSRTRGANPRAELWGDTIPGSLWSRRVTGRVYDKRSEAAAEAINQAPGIMSRIYDVCAASIRSGPGPRGLASGVYDWRDCVRYGLHGTAPTIFGGSGINLIIEILLASGYRLTARREPSALGDDCYDFTACAESATKAKEKTK